MAYQTSLTRAARLAFVTSLTLLVVKFFAYFLTDSKAILSDAVESIINVVTAAFLMVTVAVSSLPADENHPYGHGKVEAFSAGLEGGLIILAAIMILVEAVPLFFLPEPPTNLVAGTMLVLAAALINLLVGAYLLYAGKKLKSEALQADGHHLLVDVYTSAGVVIGLLLVRYTGVYWLDPLVACLIAINILIPGFTLVRKSFRNLMNEAEPEVLDRVVASLNKLQQPGLLHPHKLRALRSGRYHHFDLHIILPRYWPLAKVHAAQQEITSSIMDSLGEEGDIMIHVDPCEADYCPDCEADTCPERHHHASRPAAGWTLEQVVAPKPEAEAGEKS